MRSLFLISVATIIISFFLFSGVAGAKSFSTKAQFAFLIDNSTGTVLLDKEGNTSMAPSSMSKLMTLYMLFDRLKNGQIHLNDEFFVSKKAWKTGGSKMFVEVGKKVTVEDLIRGIIIQSGNDACIVVAENLAGSEEEFAGQMNDMAEKIGLHGSYFVNSTGLPAEGHVMSAKDIAHLSFLLATDFPEYYPYFAEKIFTYSKITQRNRNLLLWRDESVDGLKTGHTEAAGYGIVVSAERDGRRLTAVVNGLNSEKQRADEAQKLLEYGFRNFKTVKLFQANEPVERADVWFGGEDYVNLVSSEDIVFTVPAYDIGKLELQVVYDSPIPAPVQKGQHIADLEIKGIAGKERVAIPLVAGEEVAVLSFLGHIIESIGYYISGII